MKKRFFAVLLTLCMVFTLLPVSALATGSTMTWADFEQAVIDGNGTFDGNGVTVTWQPSSGCWYQSNTTHTCVADHKAPDAYTPDRLQNSNAQYQIFSDLADISISNVNFVFDGTSTTIYLCTNTGTGNSWGGVDNKYNAELQFLNSGDLTITNCTFNKIIVSPFSKGGSTATDTAATITGCTFTDVYNAYAIKDIYPATATISNNIFNHCSGDIYFEGRLTRKAISITGNTFNNTDTTDNDSKSRLFNRGIIQLSTAFTKDNDTSITISGNTITGTTVEGGLPVLRQMANLDGKMITGWTPGVAFTTKIDGSNLTLPNMPSDSTHTFIGWSTTYGSTTADYKAGAAVAADVYYAIWETKIDKDDPGKNDWPGLNKQVNNGTTAAPDWQDNGSVEAGGTVEFKLESNIPKDLKNYLESEKVDGPTIETQAVANDVLASPDKTKAGFTSEENGGTYYLAFHDVMDSNLTMNPTSVKLTVNGKDLVVTPDEDDPATGGEIGVYVAQTGENGQVTYALTSVGTYAFNQACATGTETTDTLYAVIDLVAIYNGFYRTESNTYEAYFTMTDAEDFDPTTPIVLTYSATANKDLTHGTYNNDAWVEYEGGSTAQDVAQVYCYAIQVYKYDQQTGVKGEDGTTTYSPLAGAKFALYYDVEKTKQVGDVKVSGTDGYLTFEGLKAGTYYLEETEAPDGYVKSDTLLTITLPEMAGSDQLAKTNFANSNVPHTGGTGTVMFTLGGAALIAAAGVVMITTRKKGEREK